MDQVRAAKIHAALQATLKAFAAEHGLVCSGANTKYTSTELRTGIITFADRDANPAGDGIDPKLLSDFKRRAFMLNLTEEMLGKEFTLTGRNGLGKFKLIGMRASKIIMKDIKDGKMYRYDDVIAPKLVAQFAAMKVAA